MESKKQKNNPSKDGKKNAGNKKDAKKNPEKKPKEKQKKKKVSGELVIDSRNIIPHSGEELYADWRDAVLRQRDVIDNARWNLAEALFHINNHEHYAHWGYPTWDSYVVTEVGMTARTASYLVAMFGWFTEGILKDLTTESAGYEDALKRRDEIINQIKELGWTKGKCLVGVLTLDNAKEWIEKARKMSATELEGATKRELQKLKGKPTSEVSLFKNVSFRLAEEQLAIVENAIELASETLESDKRGHVLSMICQDYVSTTMAQTESGQSKKGRYFDRIGAMFGVRMIAVDKETGKVIHGDHLLSELNGPTGDQEQEQDQEQDQDQEQESNQEQSREPGDEPENEGNESAA